METQSKTWDAIAPEWHEFKIERPSQHAKEFLENKTGNILDLGSGSGRHLQAITNGKMFLSDFSKEMIERAKQKAKKEKIEAEFSVNEMTKLPYEDNFFDSAISIAAIHCLPSSEHKKTIKEIYRVLKPNAEALIEVWNKQSNRFIKHKSKEKFVGWRDKGKRYYYLFDEEEIYNIFKKQGFEIIKKLNHSVNISFIVRKPNKVRK